MTSDKPQIERLLPCGDPSIRYGVEEGTSQVLQCRVNAYPEMTETAWFSHDTNAPDDAGRLPQLLGNETQYALHGVTRYNDTFYWCSATNDLGNSGKRLCQLYVQCEYSNGSPLSSLNSLASNTFSQLGWTGYWNCILISCNIAGVLLPTLLPP